MIKVHIRQMDFVLYKHIYGPRKCLGVLVVFINVQHNILKFVDVFLSDDGNGPSTLRLYS